MAELVPEVAPVRPRVHGRSIDGERLLEEVIEEYAEESADGVVWLLGSSGSGKTTALKHLAAVFEGNSQIAFLDDADQLDREKILEQLRSSSEYGLIVVTSAESNERPQIRLQPWNTDAIVEYLLATHPQECRSVMERLGAEAKKWWDPEVARVVLDEMASDSELTDVVRTMTSYVRSQLNSSSQFTTARKYCLEAAAGRQKPSVWTRSKFFRLPGEIQNLLRHRMIQVRLAAEQLCVNLQRRSPEKALTEQVSLGVVEAVATCVERQDKLRAPLHKVLESPPRGKSHAMAASILKHADPVWRPPTELVSPNFAGAYFSDVHWPEANFQEAHLELAEFFRANLAGACFDQSIVVEADFVDANLQGSSFQESLATGASFDRADLKHANLYRVGLERASLAGADLRYADLTKANLCRANLRDACFTEAKMCNATLVSSDVTNVDFSNCDLRRIDARRVDLRSVNLEGANMEEAWLNGANLEEVVLSEAMLPEAGLRGAHLTGSRFPNADLRKADLRVARMGEIEWEYADLRDADFTGATFHMGSSRSGLVNSSIASEGTRTGFYTDDLEELYFKTPEEVRKANLRGADLRGATITHVDFYLVDLRDAKLDRRQRAQAAQTGAILSG